MKRFIISICLLSALFVGCNQNEVEYHYSPEVLDEEAQAIMGRLRNPELRDHYYVTPESIKKSWDENKNLEYGDCSGAIPEYDFRLDTASIFDSNGYRTLAMGKEGSRNIIYIHGGAWTYPLLKNPISLLEDFLPEADAKAYLPLYPLLPRWNNEQTMTMLLELYEKLLEEEKPIIIMGDSAGGNLVLAFTAYLHSLGEKLPSCLMPISPAVDLLASNPEISKYKDRDPMLDSGIFGILGPAWAGEKAVDDPTISPMYADLKNFPPVFIFIGTEEILYPDTIDFAEKLTSEGVRTSVLVGQGLWHVAPLSKIPVRSLYISLALDFLSSLHI